jgi:hypothetical protein
MSYPLVESQIKSLTVYPNHSISPPRPDLPRLQTYAFSSEGFTTVVAGLLSLGGFIESPVETAAERPAAVWVDPTVLNHMVRNMGRLIAKADNFTWPSVSAADPSKTEFEGATVTLAVLQFCGANKLVRHLTDGITMARKHLSRMASVNAHLESDPEDGDQYVVLKVASPRAPNVDLESYLRYSEEWSDSVPWPASRLIILDFNSSGSDSEC